MSWVLVIALIDTGVTQIPQRSQQTCEIARQVVAAQNISVGQYIFCVPMKAKELPEDLTP